MDNMGGELVRLSRALHHPRSKQRLFAMLDITAYCDESVRDGDGVFVIAGYLATLKNWVNMSEVWDEFLRDENLTEFKASDCEGGNGEFQGRGEDECRRICERFVSIIEHSGLVGVAMIVDLRAYDPIRPEMDRLRTRPTGHGKNVVKLGEPYYLGFQFLVERLTQEADNAPLEEKVMYVFDITKAHKGKAVMLFDEMKHKPNYPLAERMGAISFDDSKHYAGLQAADMFAYEARRFFEEVAYGIRPHPERWQWERMTNGQRIRVGHVDSAHPTGQRC
jgi:Protein of unknown function (DUF3800)